MNDNDNELGEVENGMDNKDGLIESKEFNVKQVMRWCMSVAVLCLSVGFTYSKLSSQNERTLDKVKSLQEGCVSHDRVHDDSIEKMIQGLDTLDKKIERESYNNEQLTYRLNSAQQKQVDNLILDQREQKVRYEFIQNLLKEIKEEIKENKK